MGITITLALFIEFFNPKTAEGWWDKETEYFETIDDARAWFEAHKDKDLVDKGYVNDCHPALYDLIDEYAEYIGG